MNCKVSEMLMNYTTQDYKTEEQRFVSGVNCIPEIARDQMMMVKRQFGKEGVSPLSIATSSLLLARLRLNGPTKSA